MELNEDKHHLLVTGHRYETLWAKIGETRIWESKNKKLLGLTIDRNLNFDDHVCVCVCLRPSTLKASSVWGW